MKTERNILIAFILNISFAIFEFIGGIFTNSVAIISDSIHDIGDALSIGLSFFLEKISKKEPNQDYTYGYVRYSVLGAVITTTILLVSSILIIINSISRLKFTEEINYQGMIIFAIIGFVVNLLAAIFTKDNHSINQKAVNLHMLEDVLGWLIVLVGSIVMRFTDIKIIDPIMSIILALFILISSLKNLKLVLNLFLEKVPTNISVPIIKEDLLKIDGVIDIHHIHIWSIDGFNNCATMHVIAEGNYTKVKDEIRKKLKEHDIIHVTIEIELNDECKDIECHINHFNKLHHHH